MEVLYHIRPYFVGIFPYIGLTYGRYLQFRNLKSPVKYIYIINMMCVFATQQPFHSWTIRAARKFQFDMFGRCLVAVFQSWSQSGNRFFPSGTSQTTNKHYRPTERFKLKQFEPYNIVFGGKFCGLWAPFEVLGTKQGTINGYTYSTYSLLSGEPSFPITWFPGLGCSGCRV